MTARPQYSAQRSSRSIWTGRASLPPLSLKAKSSMEMPRSGRHRLILRDKSEIRYLLRASAKFSIGRRNFDRRFIKSTGNTPIEYAQRVRVESAKKAFETTRKTITEVMYEVGYSDVKVFREVFRKFTGVSPLAYRSRYNKEAARH